MYGKTELYDLSLKANTLTHIAGKTIVVDPRNPRPQGSINNTIIHECVHWDKHRKAIQLEMLNNHEACFSCKDAGAGLAEAVKETTKTMEWQANQLAPRIQMPAKSFKAKATEYIENLMREKAATYENEVMEEVISSLADAFAVSKQAAKLRLFELGFDNALGTYIYVDDHYVRPHGFRKGTLNINQTFTLSMGDAISEIKSNPDFRKLTENGAYQFLENHFVINAPQYVKRNSSGALILTDYALSHMDECCLVFDLKISNAFVEEYNSLYYLNRQFKDISFMPTFHNRYENISTDRQTAYIGIMMDEWQKLRSKMTDDPEQCIKLLMKWENLTYFTLSERCNLDERTIRRIVKQETTPKFDTVVRICFAFSLPYIITGKLLEAFGFRLMPTNKKHNSIEFALTYCFTQPYSEICDFLDRYGVKI